MHIFILHNIHKLSNKSQRLSQMYEVKTVDLPKYDVCVVSMEPLNRKYLQPSPAWLIVSCGDISTS